MVDDTKALARFISAAAPVTMLTGAGVSTASGIPEYRDRDGNWKHAKPVQFNDFVRSDPVRRRYWARSFSGWSRIGSAKPNSAHDALAGFEHRGYSHWLITQNVDGLHSAAGSRRITDLHGRLDTVCCLSCDARSRRADWQLALATANPAWQSAVASIRPDGDAELADNDARSFVVPDCSECGGVIKPDVVFFGEAVPRSRVEDGIKALKQSGGLLVTGSSLMVFSGYRFARLALEMGKPVAIVNKGRTRADDIASLKIDDECGEVLSRTLACLDNESKQSV
ncbi:MAG: NAD-dependent protein deacetylase [Woeseiaceae bacterium]|nr:NAD-dependent protein deacetylase [Woeseiaceae bacterium]